MQSICSKTSCKTSFKKSAIFGKNLGNIWGTLSPSPAVRASPALPLLVDNMDVLFVLSSMHGWFFLSYSLKISLRNGEEIAYNNVRLSRLEISSHRCFMGGEDLQTKGTQQESASR